MKQLTIEALSAVAEARTSWDTFHALQRAQEILGDEAEAYRPLLESLARRQSEFERLERLAGCDPMTGVANRRTFDSGLARELSRHRRTGEGFALIALDLDDLKLRNDAFGHAAGDAAIKAFAEVCKELIRGTDLVARLGGDEFVILLAGADTAGARVVAERLRYAVEAVQIDGLPLRVSLGVAVASAEAEGDSLLQAADAALYRDKTRRKSAPRLRCADEAVA